MFILMLGGTGPMGIHLSKILSENGHNVYITSRKPHEDKGNVHYIVGNARDPLFIDGLIAERRWDSIVDFMVYNTHEFQTRLGVLLKHTRQYVFLSSARVYVNSNNPLNELSPRLLDESKDKKYLETDEYALYKAREENLLLKSGYNNFTILRPYITYAENRLPLGIWEKETWVRRVLAKKDLVLPRVFLEKATTLSYGKDVSQYISHLIGNANAIGQILNIVDDKSYLWSDILRFYLDEVETITGKRPKVFIVESFTYSFRRILFNFIVSRLTFGLANGLIKVRNYNYQLIYDREFNRKFDNRKLKDLIPGYAFSNIEISLRHCLKVFSSSPAYSYRDWNWEFVQDKITGNKTNYSDIPTISLKLRCFIIQNVISKKNIVKI